MGVALSFLLYALLFPVSIGPFNNQGYLQLGGFALPEMPNNFGLFAFIILWLPSLLIASLFLGRFFCGNLCPLGGTVDLARFFANKARRWRSCGSLRSQTNSIHRMSGGLNEPRSLVGARRLQATVGFVLPASYVLVTYYVFVASIQTAAVSLAYFLITLLLLAAVTGAVFPRRAFCRFICPIGAWLARIGRLSIFTVRPNLHVCSNCNGKPCVTGSEKAGPCPVFLNPSTLDSSKDCLLCFNCVRNCPEEKAGMRLGIRIPGAELARPYAPNLWEALYIAGLFGMYFAVIWAQPHGVVVFESFKNWAVTYFPSYVVLIGNEIQALVPYTLAFAGLFGAAVAGYVGLSGLTAVLSGARFMNALKSIGYILLPLEFGIALNTMGDDMLEFLSITQPAAGLLIGGGFVGSMLVALSIVRGLSRNSTRALLALIPVMAVLVSIMLQWMTWYVSGAVIDVT